MARSTTPLDVGLVELPGVIHTSTLEISWQHRVQTFLTGHRDQQGVPKEESEGRKSDPIQ